MTACLALHILSSWKGVVKIGVGRNWLLITVFYFPFASGAAVVTIPSQPEAYEPFTIEVSSGIPRSFPGMYSLDVMGDVITVEYGRFLSPFSTPPMPALPLTTTVPGLSPGTYTIEVLETIDGIEERGSVTIKAAPETQPVYAFFHPGINHYFVTAGEDEAELVRANGWHSADAGFNVWPADGPAPEAALPVCRFYSSLVNSHFYTASEEECDYLQSFDSGWEYEGIAFRALVPIEGSCPSGTTPVWRLYNGRADLRDSNHRFLTSTETYRTMIEYGLHFLTGPINRAAWVGEGLVYCSPPDLAN